MKTLKLISRSPAETQQLGMQLGKLAQPGYIYLLSGNLGTGKTCLTQGIVWGLDSREYALSPTFVLVREIQGRLPLYHIDLYRLDRVEEIADLGLDEYLYGQGLCVIEWAEKGFSVLPGEHLLVKIEYLEDTERRFELLAQGKRYENLLEQLASTKKRVS
ncbi:MAG: tRNA (adenosine(37)-N6)-threonylcarbamoyltransferase complex ATPase subunit type 1 TsaE [Dehalococcoidales bacterium]|nr:tRNA (adenosine(37)-N6)-threonylcarbamoyltransferase complex ATPase subunit type 1 TsaE [Dehalococcoidales bacterium]